MLGKSLTVALLSVALFGCDNSTVNPVASNTSTPTSGIQTKITCLSGNIVMPSNTYAQLRGYNTKVILDAHKCFDPSSLLSNIQLAAARIGGSNIDSTIVIKNDSSLFSLTIPASMLGDTFQMVQTDMAIRRTTIGEYDSIIAIFYDSLHIKERKAAMRKAATANSADYSLKFYSPDTGKPFQVHFEYHKGAKVWTSELVTAEPGSSFDRNDTELASGNVPTIDTVYSNEYGTNWIDTIKSYSMYGIATITIDGKNINTFSDTAWGINSHTVKVIDNAGYSNIKTITEYNGHQLDTNEFSVKTKYFTLTSDTIALYTIKNISSIVYDSLNQVYKVNGHINYMGHELQSNIGYHTNTNDFWVVEYTDVGRGFIY